MRQWYIAIDCDGIYCETLEDALAVPERKRECIGEIHRVNADGSLSERILHVMYKDGALWSMFNITKMREDNEWPSPRP